MAKLLAALLVALPFLAQAAGVSKPSAVSSSGTSAYSLTAPSYVSLASSGANGFACSADGCRVDLGTGTSDYLYSNGTNVMCGGNFYAPTVFSTTFSPLSATSGYVRGQIADSGSAIGVKVGNLTSLTTTGAKIAAFYSDNATTEKASVGIDGWFAGATEHTLWTWYFNAAAATGACPATGTGCTGHVLPAKAFTVTGVTGMVSIVSGGGAANTVWTITDGTNTCTATFACNTVTNSTGAKRVATANGAGTGCVYAANAALSISVTTAGCTTTQPTFRNVDIVGKWQ